MLHGTGSSSSCRGYRKSLGCPRPVVVHLLLQQRIRQRIMLAKPRAKPIRESQKVFLVNLVEDGDHGLLDHLVFQGRDPQWTLPPIFFLYAHSPRGQRSIRPRMNPSVEIDEPILQSGLILLPRHSTPGAAFLFNE